MHCLRTALCESIRYQAKTEQKGRQDWVVVKLFIILFTYNLVYHDVFINFIIT